MVGRQQKHSVSITLFAAIALWSSCRASEQPVSGERSVDPQKWELTLREAGASPAELAEFKDLANASWFKYFLDSPPHTFLRLLRRIVRGRQEPAPTAIFRRAPPIMSCDALRGVYILDTTIDSAGVAATDGSCRVTATVVHSPAVTHIKVFVALPTHDWNGRFTGTGGGGYAGGSLESLDEPVARGYAVGATDTGNEQGTANFALDAHGKPAWQRIRDNAYIGIHDMTVVGKSLTEAFYGKAARYSYFIGGSTGGRQALTEAQRYPEDYDGILALAPAIARDRYVPAQLWPQIVMREANDFLSSEKREAATAAAVKACDGADGVMDGVIDDPTRCEYDAANLVGTRVGNETFTATDARIIREIWDGPRGHDGSALWWGPTRGTDLSTLADTGGTPLTGKPCDEGLDWFRYFLVRDPDWDWRTLTRSEFERLFRESIQRYASIYGGDDPNLTAFRDRGGKLLIVHGLADQFVPPQKSIAYYKSVEQEMGGPQKTAEFLRLFLVPGADHGFMTAVPTPDFAAVVEALLEWVEHGQVPERLYAELIGDHGELTRTRPLFPYPKVARYRGNGSTDVAANFSSSSQSP